MDSPLWTDTHSPDLPDIRQADAREYLEHAVGVPLNIMVTGPRGVGKTAAVRALAEASHDNADTDFMEINVADFFDQSKSDIRDDPRFKHFLQGQTEFSKQYRRSGDKTNQYKRNWSKREMLGHVLKEMAGYEATSGTYKTILLDNAEEMREDFQQALRRVMENYHQTTQFILISRSSSGIIPAIQSRCFPLPMESPEFNVMKDVIVDIADAEDVEYNDAGIDFLIGYSDGDIRNAILSLQTVDSQCDSITPAAVKDTLENTGVGPQIVEAIETAENGDIKSARKIVDDLLIDEGMSGEEVLQLFVKHSHARYSNETCLTLIDNAATIDMQLVDGASDRVHLTNYLTEIDHAT